MTAQETIKQAAAEAIERINTIANQTTAAITKLTPKMPNLDQPVVVAGIKWGDYLTPFEKCDAQSKFNEETGLHYFSFDNAIPHAYHQHLRLPTNLQYQQLHDRATRRKETIGKLKYEVFTDKETGEELWMILGGWYNFGNGSFYAVGSQGYYWSSVECNSSSGYSLWCYSGNVYPQGSNDRANGFPVRCILE